LSSGLVTSRPLVYVASNEHNTA